MKLLLCVFLLTGIAAGDHDSKPHHRAFDFGNLLPDHSTGTKQQPDQHTGMTDHDMHEGGTTQQRKFQNSLQSQFKTLPRDKQNILFNRSDQLSHQKSDFLDAVPTRVLGSLPPSTLRHVSGKQLKGQVSRFHSMSLFGIHNLLDGVNDTTFRYTLPTMKQHAMNFTKSQARSTVQRYVSERGKVNSWKTKQDFDDLGGLRKGMTCQQTSSMQRVAFDDDSIAGGFRNDAEKGNLDKSQRKGVVESKKAQKKPSKWNSDDLKQLGPMMTETGNHNLKQIPDDAVSGSMRDQIGKQKWDDDQSRTLINKFQSGRNRNLSQLRSSDMTDLGSLRSKMGTEQNRKLSKDAFNNVAEYVGKWGNPKSGTTQTTAQRYFEDKLGKQSNGRVDTSKLKSVHMTRTPKLMAGLSKTELRNISGNELKMSIGQTSADVGNMNTHQAKVAVDKMKGNLTRDQAMRGKWSEDMIRSLGSYMSGFKSRDIDEMNSTHVARAVLYDDKKTENPYHKGLKNHVKNALPSMQRKLTQKTRAGGETKLSKMGRDLSQHVSLRQMRSLPDSDTVDDKDDKDDEDGPTSSFSRHQKFQLFDRFKKPSKLGEPDALDVNNQTKWTGRQIREKVGGLLTGATSDDLKKLPIDTIPDAMSTLGKHDYTHKQGQTMVNSFRQQLMPNFTAFDSSDVSSLGPMVDQLYGKDLDDLRRGTNGRNNTKQVVCQLRNKDLTRNSHQKRNDLFNRGLEALTSEDKSRNRRAATREISADTVDKLGNLMSGIDTRDIPKLSSEALETKMGEFAKLFNGTQRKELADHVVRKLGGGHASMLRGSHLSNMGPAAQNLSDDHLRSLNPTAVGDALDDLRNLNYSRMQGSIMLGHAEKHFNRTVQQWNGNHFRRVKNMNIGHKPGTIRNMTADDLDDSLDSFPSQKMDSDQQEALRDAVKMKLGGGSVQGISEDHLVQLGTVANGDRTFLGMRTKFADSERSIDVLGHNGGQAMDRPTAQAGFNTIKSKRMQSNRPGGSKDLSQYDSTDISNMGEFITGASERDINMLNATAVADALPRLGQNHYQNMDSSAFNALRQKASQGRSIRGALSAGEAGERGTLAGSDDTRNYEPKHLQAMSPDTLKNMRTDAAQNIPADSYREMGSDNARVMQQRSDFMSLDSSRQDAINSAAMQDTLYAPEDDGATQAPPSGGSKVGAAVLFTSLMVAVVGVF